VSYFVSIQDHNTSRYTPATLDDMKTYIDDHDYIMNLVIDSTADGNLDNVGLQLSSGGAQNRVFQRDGNGGGYTTYKE